MNFSLHLSARIYTYIIEYFLTHAVIFLYLISTLAIQIEVAF